MTRVDNATILSLKLEEHQQYFTDKVAIINRKLYAQLYCYFKGN